MTVCVTRHRTADQKGPAVTVQPEPVDDDSYPASWRPRERRDRDAALEPLAVEKHLAAMDKRELTLLLQRIEAMR